MMKLISTRALHSQICKFAFRHLAQRSEVDFMNETNKLSVYFRRIFFSPFHDHKLIAFQNRRLSDPRIVARERPEKNQVLHTGTGLRC